MGLPLFITPKEPEAIAKSTEKSAAAPRSAIRRRPTARVRNPANTLRQRQEERWGRLEAEAEDFDREWRLRSAARMARLRAFEHETQEATGSLPSWGNLDQPFIERRMSPAGFLTGFAIGERVEGRREMEERWRSEPYRSERWPRAAPTPPYNDSESNASETGVSPILPAPLAITPALSPAPPSGRSSPRRSTLNRGNIEFRRSDIQQRTSGARLVDRVEALSRSVEDWRRSRNNLRRARINRQSQVDGLGDRARSISPDGAWDTLLTSITPDPQPPSAGSSFASTGAATANVSTSTSLTTPETLFGDSRTGQNQSQNQRDDCDLLDANTDEDDEEDIYELLELDSRGERRNLDWRTYATGARSTTPSQDQLRGMHQIIAGLVEREDIPDEWWASVGLSRNL